jgi:protein-S-isoprenylcysteine O-methyltransferase Ste14
MKLVYQYLFQVMWLSWAAWWLALSRNVKRTTRHEPMGSRLLHIVPLTLAMALLWPSHSPTPLLGTRILPLAAWPFWIGGMLTAIGLLFAVWARHHIGTNWSGSVTIKQDHQLVIGGPYALVRHPIYTGLLLAVAGSALAQGELRSVLALGLACGAVWRKVRLEERWMRERFGSPYDEYSRRVPALVPHFQQRTHPGRERGNRS